MSYLIGAIVLIFLISLTLWWFSDLYFAREVAPFQQTPDWTKWTERIPPGTSPQNLRAYDPNIPLDVRPSMHLRTDSDGSKLFLKHRYGTIIYLYDSSTRTISEATENDWLKASGEICNCWDQLAGDYNQKVKFNTYPDYDAILDGKKIDTYGHYVLFSTESHNRSFAALLSAYGPQFAPSNFSVIPFLGGSEAVVKGQKYVEIFDIKSGKFVKEPVRVTGGGANLDYRFCWSADEKYLVVYKPNENFSIIENK